MPKNQHMQKKLLNFENWCMGRCQKLGIIIGNKVIQKLMTLKNVNDKKGVPRFIFFNEKN